MPKRKRSLRGKEEVGAAKIAEIKKVDLEKKLVHGRKVLNRALKTARGFERQKLSKRIKLSEVEQDRQETTRLQRELSVLKALDLQVAVESHLYKNILKSKSISDSGLLPGCIKSFTKMTHNSQEEQAAISNVTARMYNTKPVKEAMSHVIVSIHNLLGISNPSANTKIYIESVNNDLNKKGVPKPANHDADLDTDVLDSHFADESQTVLEAPTDLVALDLHPKPYPELELASANDSDGTNDKLEDPSSDDERDGHIHDNNARVRASSPLPRLDQSKDTSRSSSRSSPSPFPQPRPRRLKKPAEQGSSRPGSTFLPTLMGGYWSGSESVTDEEHLSTRKKNRPGQQARRVLWEKKFGAKANHLKGQTSAKSRNNDWDPRRGARGAEERHFRRGSAAGRNSKTALAEDTGRSTGENSIAIKPRARGMGKKDNAGPLHPSWEAAKKAKEAKQTVPFQGKKIVFE